jgi:hypothetical protein
MSPDTVLALEKIVNFCHEKWAEADKAPPAEWPTPDMWLGKEMAYNNVLQFARKILENKV